MDEMKEGVYDQLVTRRVRRALEAGSAQGLRHALEEIEEPDCPDYLARHLSRQIRAYLRGLDSEQRKERQLAFTNTLLELVRTEHEADAVDPAGEVLRSVYRGPTAPAPPTTPLSATDLLMNAAGSPRLGFELERELATADRVLMLVSFIQWRGWQRLRDAFHELASRGVPVRI